ncbi:reverse transcriptase/ribonuclease H/putative methyltransferase, partial [Triplophysa rosa]
QPLPPSARWWTATRRCVMAKHNVEYKHQPSALSVRQCVQLRNRQAGKTAEPISSPGARPRQGIRIEAMKAEQTLSPPVSVPGSLAQLPRPSGWLGRMIRLGYAIQFARSPPKFRGILSTSVRGSDQARPTSRDVQRVLQPVLHCPKKGGGLHPIRDLRALNKHLHKLPFRRITQKRILMSVRCQDWFMAIDLEDAYFYVSILHRHRPFLRFSFEGRALQYRSSPLVCPCLHVSSRRSRKPPSFPSGKEVCGYYLDDWLILAHSRDLLCTHRDLVLRHLDRLGLQVNWEKSKLSPVQSILFLGMELDSVSMTARLTTERSQSVLNCLKVLRQSAVPLKQLQRLLGHMASSTGVVPLGLMHMRPLQHWLQSQVPWRVWHTGSRRMVITPFCLRTLTPWSSMTFLRTGVLLGQVSRHVVVMTDASLQGWGAVCNGHAVSGRRMGPRLRWHINCLELLAVLPALKRLQPLVQGKHVLVRDQVVNLQALPTGEEYPTPSVLCPVRTLRLYLDRTQSYRSSEQLFVFFGGQQKGRAVSKQRLAHWIVDAVATAYQSQDRPCPLGGRAHSTRGVASSWALAQGASLADICRAAGWATPSTFVRFYNLRVEPVSARVLQGNMVPHPNQNQMKSIMSYLEGNELNMTKMARQLTKPSICYQYQQRPLGNFQAVSQQREIDH